MAQVKVTLQAVSSNPALGRADVIGDSVQFVSPGENAYFTAVAQPAADAMFVHWSGTAGAVPDPSVQEQTSVTVSVPESATSEFNATVVAHFCPLEDAGGTDEPLYPGQGAVALVANAGTGGKLVYRDRKADSFSITKYGTPPNQSFHEYLDAEADYGYEFDRWSVQGTTPHPDPVNPYILEVIEDFPPVGTRDIRVDALFKPKLVTITVNASASPAAWGEVEPESESYTVEFGSSHSFDFKATPKQGYRFVEWTKGGVVVSRNSHYQPSVKADTEGPITWDIVARFEPVPPYGPPPPDYPDDPPDPPVYDGSPAIEVNASVATAEAARLGATAYPPWQRKVRSGSSDPAEFTIEATPQSVTEGATTYVFSHWEDMDGHHVSTDRIYTFTKSFPSDGTDTYGFSAVYVLLEPRKGYRSMLVISGAGPTHHGGAPSGGEAFSGYGTVAGGGLSLAGSAYDSPESDIVTVESYVVGFDEDKQKFVYDNTVRFPNFTASNPTDGHCRFVRWEATTYTGGFTGWVSVTTDRTVTQDQVSRALGGLFDDATIWADVSPFLYAAVRAVFEIPRVVSFEGDPLCYRNYEDGRSISVGHFPTAERRLYPGQTAYVEFAKESASDADPPDGTIRCKCEVKMSAFSEEPETKSFRSTKNFTGLLFTAPSSVSDFKLVAGDDKQTDINNGWRIHEVKLTYHELTGLPIADYDPETGVGSGELLHDTSGNVICDDSACPLNL